jgi:hypothetical protein
MTGEPTNAPCRIAAALFAAALVCSAVLSGAARAATLAEKAKESGCVNKPVAVSGTLFKCATVSGDPSYFNVPGAAEAEPAPRTAPRTASAPSPSGFPKVDAGTQKGRDDVRRKVLSEELATEEKLLSEARVAYADGAPKALPEEKSDVEKYRDRIARLRQAVGIHEKNIEALKKELASVK